MRSLETAQKVAIMVGPQAALQLESVAAAHGMPGENNWVGLDLMIGLPTGLRAQFFPYKNKLLNVALEGVYGADGLSATYGGGVRVQFRVVSGAKNALIISPGVDIYISPTDPGFFGHYGTWYYVATDADIEWLHQFGDHWAFELGTKLGGQLQIQADGNVRPLPVVSLFTGIRY
ncbi:hypothetical protein WDW37_17875 [Bdellovibrionota bacterium FG-1]